LIFGLSKKPVKIAEFFTAGDAYLSALAICASCLYLIKDMQIKSKMVLIDYLIKDNTYFIVMIPTICYVLSKINLISDASLQWIVSVSCLLLSSFLLIRILYLDWCDKEPIVNVAKQSINEIASIEKGL